MITKSFKEITLSRLGMGNMRLPCKADGEIDYARGEAMIDTLMKAGVNYYDTAYVYHSGKSEDFVGKALVSRYPRDSFYIATKYLLSADPDYKAVFARQLERLRTDHIDFYLIHAVGDDSAAKYIEGGSVEYFEEQQKSGKIKYLGFSAHCSTETLRKFASHRKWDFAQLQINYYDWVYGNAKEQYELLCELGIPVMVMEPVRGGKLAELSPAARDMLTKYRPEWSIASWAFRWLMKLDNVAVILSGMSDMGQAADNIRTFSEGTALTDDEERLLLTACEAFRGGLVVPCTGCRYCTDSCPAQINIPEVMTVYNHYKVDGDWVLWELDNIDSKGNVGDCVSCGLCAEHCPQGIKIPGLMRELVSKRKK